MEASPIFLSWLIHSTIFWGTVSFIKLTGAYKGPSALITSWSAIIYLQLAISLIGIIIIDFNDKRQGKI